MVPAASMAMVQTSDADLAAITGQSGVDIAITGLNIELGLGTLTWGDYDGKPVGTAAPSAANAGFINTVFYPVPISIGIGAVNISVDVDTRTKTSVILGVSIPGAITINGIIADVVLDETNGALTDFLVAGSYVGATNAAATVLASGATTLNTLNTKTLGVVGLSGVSATISSMTIAISAH
jgi:hypothetical protein